MADDFIEKMAEVDARIERHADRRRALIANIGGGHRDAARLRSESMATDADPNLVEMNLSGLRGSAIGDLDEEGNPSDFRIYDGKPPWTADPSEPTKDEAKIIDRTWGRRMKAAMDSKMTKNRPPLPPGAFKAVEESTGLDARIGAQSERAIRSRQRAEEAMNAMKNKHSSDDFIEKMAEMDAQIERFSTKRLQLLSDIAARVPDSDRLRSEAWGSEFDKVENVLYSPKLRGTAVGRVDEEGKPEGWRVFPRTPDGRVNVPAAEPTEDEAKVIDRIIGRRMKAAMDPKMTKGRPPLPGPVFNEVRKSLEQDKRAASKRRSVEKIMDAMKDKHSSDDFIDRIAEIDAQAERFSDPDERRRKFLKSQVAGSGENVDKLKGPALKKAAMMGGALQTGRAPADVRKGVEKRMKKENG
jgi:hypothetical protein